MVMESKIPASKHRHTVFVLQTLDSMFNAVVANSWMMESTLNHRQKPILIRLLGRFIRTKSFGPRQPGESHVYSVHYCPLVHGGQPCRKRTANHPRDTHRALAAHSFLSCMSLPPLVRLPGSHINSKNSKFKFSHQHRDWWFEHDPLVRTRFESGRVDDDGDWRPLRYDHHRSHGAPPHVLHRLVFHFARSSLTTQSGAERERSIQDVP